MCGVAGLITKRVAKAVAKCISVSIMFPAAALTGFGRSATMFQLFAQAVALLPGKPGDYLRVAYYFMTLRKSTFFMRLSFGSLFAHRYASVGDGVYIGAYCVLGQCSIGERTQIGTHAQILSGRRQHERDNNGRILGSEKSSFSEITIGADCWIGAAAIIMADIGPRTTIGAGAVVTKPIPADSIAVGNPARVIREVQA